MQDEHYKNRYLLIFRAICKIFFAYRQELPECKKTQHTRKDRSDTLSILHNSSIKIS